MHKVVIIQEYVPQYRVPFFTRLMEGGREFGIDIRIVSGVPGPTMKSRNDAASSLGTLIPQREFQIGGRRIVWRKYGDAINGADLVVLEQARRNVDAYRLLLTPKRKRRHLTALWGHGRDYTRRATFLESTLRRWLTSRADWFFAYTSGGVEAVVAEGYLRGHTTLTQNSIDTSALHDGVARVSADSVATFSSANDLHGKTAFFLGALDKSKRLTFLREAAMKCHGMNSDFRLLIAGDGILREEVERWSSEDEWLTYLGPINGDTKSIALASAQVIAMPGRVGLVAVDSFAAGTPIVTTNWPWHAPEFEYLENDRNAIITLDRVGVYAQSLHDTLEDSHLIGRLGDACKDDGRKITIAAMSENFLEGVRSALESRRS